MKIEKQKNVTEMHRCAEKKENRTKTFLIKINDFVLFKVHSNDHDEKP